MGRTGSDALLGRTIAGKFTVQDLIGAGAMGAVYRARQIALDKTVAIKVLHGEHADDPAFAGRFQREAKAASRLNHPNSIQIIDFGQEPDGLLYIAMEHLDGPSLHRLLREQPGLPPERAADILMQALAAIAVAHDLGIVHRDLKPENIVVLRGTDDDGRPKDIVKVLDFGIAKITDSRAYRSGSEHDTGPPVTTAGFLVGTPEYMSPEQGRGEKLDSRSDLYSIGIVLYEMLAGRLPFEAENAIGVILRHITEPPVPPSRLVPTADPRLEAICLRALRKAREERFQSAREMRAELRAVIEGRSATESGPALPPAVTIHATPTPGLLGAQAIAASGGGTMAAPEDLGLKPTLVGTATSAIPGAPRRRVALVASIFGLTGLATALAFSLLARPRHAAPAVVAAEPSAAPLVTLAADPVTVPPLSNADAPTAGHASTPHTGHVPSARSSIGPASSSASPALPSVAPAPASAPVASTTPAAPALPPPAAASPDFDPEKANVTVGIIVVQGIAQPAVRARMRGAGFTACYRRALRTQGSAATGEGKLDLSIDETGTTRSAIVTGVGFLPNLGRCLQREAGLISFSGATVDSAGATAEVTLIFQIAP